jgi:four helix bundle protein
MRVLDHEKLDVYQTARELSREVGRLLLKARNKHFHPAIIDQIVRAVASIPLNIAEGTGEESAGRKAYFYRIARASATELAAAIDHIVDLEMLKQEDTIAAKTLVVRVVSMLYKMTRAAKTPESFPPLPRARGPRKR